MRRPPASVAGLAALLALPALAQEAGDPRRRVAFAPGPDKRLEIRDAACPERVTDPSGDAGLRRRIVGTAAREWEAFGFSTFDIASAGLRPAAFPRAAQHAAYLDHLFRAPGAAFAPASVDDRPDPGDLLCAGRAEASGTADLEQGRAAAAAGAPLHCDIVVGLAPDRLYAIGGNVVNSVSLTVVPLRGGRIEPNPIRRWFGLFKLRAPADPDAAIGEARFACLGREDADACLGAL